MRELGHRVRTNLNLSVSMLAVALAACATQQARPAPSAGGAPSDVASAPSAPPAALGQPQAVPAKPADALTNDEVVKLVKLGLGEKVVIAKINQASEIDFDLETEALQRLKSKGVTANVIAAMLERASGGGGAVAGRGGFSAGGKVWLAKGSGAMELGSVAGYVEASIGQAFKQALLFSFTSKFAVIARGQRARVRVSPAPTVAYTRYSPSEIGIVRLTVQPDHDRRFVWVVSRVGSNQGEFHPPEDDIKFVDEPMADGVYKLTLSKALTPGEYGVIAPGGSTGYVVHDFGVDG